MIVHIGTGKTGSTAIQKHLRRSRKDLSNHNYCYWGLNLEYAPILVKREWQQPSGIGVLQKMPVEKALSEVWETLEKAIVNSKPDTTIVWSNESMYEMPSLYQPVLSDLKSKHNFELKIVAYARSIPSYILSAYKQWGVKHKTNPGGVKAFNAWIRDNRKFLGYSARLKNWEQSFPSEFSIFNYDRIDNVVNHFLMISDIPQEMRSDVSDERQNTTPNDIVLALYALYNNQFAEPSLPARITTLIKDYRLLGNQPPIPSLSSLYPSQEALSEHAEFIANETKAINELLTRHKQAPFDVNVPAIEAKKLNESELVIGVLSILVALNVQQDDRIKHLENLLKSEKRD
jgi:hypothetical protein